MTSHMWRIRPAESSGAGRAVTFASLARGIEDGKAGSLDEVRGPEDEGFLPIGEHPATADLVSSGRRRQMSRVAEEAESDMTPMIDVTFQLVIFFMIAATYTMQKTLDLPSSQPDEAAAAAVTMEELEKENIIVKIAGDGTVTVQDEPVAVENLVKHLQQASRENDTAELILDVADEAVHDVVVRVLDAAGAAQFEKVLFVSRVSASG